MILHFEVTQAHKGTNHLRIHGPHNRKELPFKVSIKGIFLK